MNQKTYIEEIDGLRALSVLAVVAFHVAPGNFGGGYIGVDIFFVISGFLITGILIDAPSQNNVLVNLLNFYKKRIRRILPALIFTISCALFFGLFLLTKNEFKSLSTHSLYAGFFANNFLLMDEIGYFDPAGIYKPLLHLWSLSVEEQFYIIFPIFILILRKNFNYKNSFLFLILIFSLTAIYCAASKLSFELAYYNPIYRSLELLSGAFLCFFGKCYPDKYKSLCDSMPIKYLFIAMFFLTFLFIVNVKFEVNIPILASIIFSILFSLLSILYFQSGKNISKRFDYFKYIFNNKISTYIGKFSFSLYLLHYPILSFASIINPKISKYDQLLLLLLAFSLSIFSYELIEKPFRKTSIKNNFFYMTCLISFLSLTAYSFFSHTNIDQAYGNGFKEQYSLSDKIIHELQWEFSKNSLCTEVYPSQFDNPKYIYGQLAYSRNFCIQNKPGDPGIIILGNSFANHLYPGFVENAQDRDTVVLSLGDCSFHGKQSDIKCGGEFWDEENTIRHQALIQAKDSLDLIVISGLLIEGEINSRQIFEELNFIQKNIPKAHIVIFLPHYTNGTFAHECYTRPLRSTPSDCDWTISDVDNFFSKINLDSFKKELISRFPEITLFDPNQIFCAYENICSITDENNLPLLRDRDHLSVNGSKKVVNKYLLGSDLSI